MLFLMFLPSKLSHNDVKLSSKYDIFVKKSHFGLKFWHLSLTINKAHFIIFLSLKKGDTIKCKIIFGLKQF